MKESFTLPVAEQLDAQWNNGCNGWRERITESGGQPRDIRSDEKRVNPKITCAKWG